MDILSPTRNALCLKYAAVVAAGYFYIVQRISRGAVENQSQISLSDILMLGDIRVSASDRVPQEEAETNFEFSSLNFFFFSSFPCSRKPRETSICTKRTFFQILVIFSPKVAHLIFIAQR